MSTIPIEALQAKLSHWLIGVALAALAWIVACSQLASFADWLVQALRLTLGHQGLLAWETLAAQMVEEGTPHPVPGALTPCGESGRATGEANMTNPKAGSASVRDCVNR